MGGDGLAFAVRVRREINFVCLEGHLLELIDDFFLARRDDQLGLEGPLLKLHADVVFGQVHNVADGGAHIEPLAQILFDCLRLGWRLDDDQCFGCCHC